MRIHGLQLLNSYSDPAMEEALHDIPLYREFCGLDVGTGHLPDESTILRFGKTPNPRHLLEAHGVGQRMMDTINRNLVHQGLLLKTVSAVDATIIATPSSTKNSTGTRYWRCRNRCVSLRKRAQPLRNGAQKARSKRVKSPTKCGEARHPVL